MKKDSLGEFFGHEPNRRLEYRQDQDLYLEPEAGGDFQAWDDDMLYSETPEEVGMYVDEAHEALNRLHQKTNKRGSGLMRPHKRSDNWQ